MLLIGAILLLVILIFVGVAVGGGILVLIAYGLGWLLNNVMHLDPFQATLLSLAGMLAFGFLASSIFQTIINTMPKPSTADDDEYEDEEDEDDELEFEVDDVDEEPVIYPSIPRWRQPLKKTPDFSNTRPDDRCPCGSGRKYKNCHGAKQSKQI